MNKKTGELILSGLFLALGIAAIAVINSQNTTAVSNTGATTFKTFPTVYGIMIVVLAAVNIARLLAASAREKRLAAKSEPEGGKANNGWGDSQNSRIIAVRVVGMFLLSVAYALLLKKLHFALLCFLFLMASFTLLGRKKIWLNAVVSAVGSGVVYLIFVILLKLPL